MHTYRLVIGPDRSVSIPDGKPGQVVTVLIEDSTGPQPVIPPVPVSQLNAVERDALKMDFLERGRRVRSRRQADELIDHASELFGDDGLPK